MFSLFYMQGSVVMAKRENPWIKHLRTIEKHLEKNEKWLQYPEKKMHHFEKNMNDWNNEFLQNMGNVEEFIKELEKRMEN